MYEFVGLRPRDPIDEEWKDIPLSTFILSLVTWLIHTTDDLTPNGGGEL